MPVTNTFVIYDKDGCKNATLSPNYTESGVYLWVEQNFQYLEMNIDDCKKLIKYLEFCIKDTSNE